MLFSKKPKTRSFILINPSDELDPERHLMQSSSPASLSPESVSPTTTIDNKGLPSFTKNFTDVLALGIFQTIGNVFTLYSLSLLSVPLVLTIKATEPMFAMLLIKCLRLQDSNLNVFKCIAMLLMVTGTIMASMKEVEFEIAAFVASVMANLGFQMRNIYAKYMSKTSLSYGYNYGILSASTFLWVFVLICGKLFLTFISFSSFTNEHHMVLQLEKDMTLLDLTGLVLVSGICYSSYNFFSLGVLSFVSPVTHSVLNSLKRLLIIWVSITLFNTPVTAVGLLGTFLVITGKFSSFITIKYF